ncbi:PilX N-terminal domain-containing pilus assembly protein [Acidovorax sp. SUPP2825]|uniref:pilus assembly PilX family protein n=1 Tax=Acidovorax sp. SUPP2825 TaxID=2920879 RepID=UPI0023DE499D|nr:PilX N-terminal domain-containing pilus assembly protein [Acidovorax sp. SUPP2825]GKS94259.1 pilus assembly protein [Acidovorax sp. SUPP2825]
MLKFQDLSVQFKNSPKTTMEKGASLIVVMLLLVIVSILGISGVQISMMAERGTRNDRDTQIAWQSAEAALMDAEFDILGLPAGSPTKRNGLFTRGNTDIDQFIPNCGTSGANIGLCALNVSGKPAWLAADFTMTGNNAPTAAFGTYTGRTFPSGNAGIQPAQPPRYVIELIPEPSMKRTKNPSDMKYIYRITAMGFGPNADTQVVSQVLFRN